MAEDTPGLAADILAAIGGERGTPAVEQTETKAVVEGAPEPAAAGPPPASTTDADNPLKRPRADGAIDDAAPEKRQRIDHAGAAHQRESGSPAATMDISAMLQSAFQSLDEQLRQTSPVEADARSLPPPAVSPITPPGPTERTIQNQRKFASSPFQVMRSMSLPLLGNLAVQILLALSQQPHATTSGLLADRESEYRRAFDLLMPSFRAARRLFSESKLLMSPDDLEVKELEDRETIRMANLATTCASILGEDVVPLVEIHEDALRILVPEDGELTQDCAQFLLVLKTHAYLSDAARALDSEACEDLLRTYFPSDLRDALKRRNLFGGPLTTIEEGLVRDSKLRRGLLQNTIGDDEKRGRLAEEYSAKVLLDQLGSFLQSHLITVVDYADKYGINIPSIDDTGTPVPLDEQASGKLNELMAGLGAPHSPVHINGGLSLQRGQDVTTEAPAEPRVSSQDGLGLSLLLQNSLANQNSAVSASESGPASTAGGLNSSESKGLASLIAETLSTLDGAPTSAQGLYPSASSLSADHLANPQSQYLSHLYQTQDSSYYPYQDSAASDQAQVGPGGENLPPNQTFPTSVLYERARQAAVAKSSAHARREGIHSTRRPWSSEEEKALMAGLDMVKGPHWSQILTLFGPNGTTSDILKDRTQVQLKDKARNLKLFFLKTNSEMPYYLQCVTGELKTRAPSQAARKEAEEKARLNSEEEQARLQGIMTLAGGLQNNAAANTSQPSGLPAAPTIRTGTAPPPGLAALASRALGTPTSSQTTAPSPAIARSLPASIKTEPGESQPLPQDVTGQPPAGGQSQVQTSLLQAAQPQTPASLASKPQLPPTSASGWTAANAPAEEQAREAKLSQLILTTAVEPTVSPAVTPVPVREVQDVPVSPGDLADAAQETTLMQTLKAAVASSSS